MLKKFFLLVAITFSCGTSIFSQDKPKEKNLANTPYWYINLGYESPFMYGDMYSVTKNHVNFGIGPNLRFGYRFSPIFGLELKGMYGIMKGNASEAASNFWLGSNSMTYYPYTLLDGTVYTPNYSPDPNKPFFGIWGNNNVGISGTKYSNAYAKTHFIQVGLLGSLNLNRLLMGVPANREQVLTLTLKPGIYLNKYMSGAYRIDDNKIVTPKYNSPLSIGLGGELALDYAISRHLGLQLYSSIMWVTDRRFDGITTVKRAMDDFIWSVGANIMVKFPSKKQVFVEPATPIVKEVAPTIPFVSDKKDEVKKDYTNFEITPFVPTIGLTKKVSISEKAMFVFYTSKYDLVPSLGDNQVYLDHIDRAFQKLNRDKDIDIKSISIVGYASPEGNSAFNKTLSENRAKAIVNYMISNYNYPQSLMKYEGLGENWNGLKEALLAWEMQGKEKLLSIIDNDKFSTDKKKFELKRCGEIYKKALDEIYPTLRKNVCIFDIEIAPYTLKDCIDKFNHSPEKLTADEMIAVANQYPMYSDEFNNVVNTGMRYFPDNKMILCYKAAILLKNNKGAEAINYLQKAGNDATALSLMGVALMQTGDMTSAKDYLNKAKAMGSNDALKNLELLGLSK